MNLKKVLESLNFRKGKRRNLRNLCRSGSGKFCKMSYLLLLVYYLIFKKAKYKINLPHALNYYSP